jgi:hypothetical protein
MFKFRKEHVILMWLVRNWTRNLSTKTVDEFC